MLKRVPSWPVVLLLAIPLRLLAADVTVPPELQPWQSWVLQGEEFRRCPYATGSQAADAERISLRMARTPAARSRRAWGPLRAALGAVLRVLDQRAGRS